MRVAERKRAPAARRSQAKVNSRPSATSLNNLAWLQRSAGNRAVAALLQRKPKVKRPAAPPPEPMPFGPFSLALNKDGISVTFTTATVDNNGCKVHITGRFKSLRATTDIKQIMPPEVTAGKKGKQRAAAIHHWAADIVRADVAKAAETIVPTALGKSVFASIAGIPVGLVLKVEEPDQLASFMVSGYGDVSEMDLAFGSRVLANASGRLYASVWVESPSGATARAGDEAVDSFGVNGHAAKFTDVKAPKKNKENVDTLRTGSVTQVDSLERIEKEWPAHVKNHWILRAPEQRSAWLTALRPWTGSDDATINHFAQIRKVAVPGSDTWLHEQAANRLEHVAAELGEKMPHSGGVAWPRDEAAHGDIISTGSLHGIGFAIDYNAYETPFLNDDRLTDFVRIVTGGEAGTRELFGQQQKIHTSGRAALKAADAGQGAGGGDAELAELAGKEFDRITAQSKAIRDSLGPENRAKLIAAWRKYQAAGKGGKEAKAEAMAEADQVIGPWRDKITAARKVSTDKLAKLVAVDEAAVRAQTAAKAAGKLERWGKKKIGKKGLDPGLRTEIVAALAALGKEAAALDDTALLAAAASAAKSLQEAGELLDKIDSIDRLATALKDPSFLFKAKTVASPSLAQLAHSGYFAVTGQDAAWEKEIKEESKSEKNPEGRDNSTRFGRDFYVTMVKYGFSPGSGFKHPDSMHFELRWPGPMTATYLPPTPAKAAEVVEKEQKAK